MKGRLKWSLLFGFFISLGLHTASAVTIALYPYNDEPLTPHMCFLFLLWPGWAIAGREYHVKVWEESIAVVINGVVCGSVVLCLLTWNAWRGGKAPSPASHRLIAIVPIMALLWVFEAFSLEFSGNAAFREFAHVLDWAIFCTLAWAFIEIGFALRHELLRKRN